ncbi:MAG TPA: putative lipid II flippase FtsW [Patescibacteria group bacterium]|nr:putative lipid II flippase FtsW [Patescibacteria group bacterium]
MKKQNKLDYPLLFIILALFAFGLAVLYSASTVESYQNFGSTTYYIIHQVIYGGVIGLLLMYICSRIHYRVWLKYLPLFLIISLLTLVLVKVPGIGFSSGGAARWILIGPLFFQPAELAKLVIVFYLAAWIDKKGHRLHDFYFGLLPSLLIVALFAAFILWQPDLGTMLILVGTAFVMLFVGGARLKYFFWTIVCAALGLYGLVKLEPYRARRLTAFLNPELDPQGISYQINQALLGIGAGGLWGYGYGLSRQKYHYLPEALNDSIFAILGEELGFFRELIVLGLFLAFALRGIKIAKAAPDNFGKMTAVGIVTWITLQAFINIAAMIGLVPLTGVPLPFFSYGSTSLLVNLAAMGVLLNISRHAQLNRA